MAGYEQGVALTNVGGEKESGTLVQKNKSNVTEGTKPELWPR